MADATQIRFTPLHDTDLVVVMVVLGVCCALSIFGSLSILCTILKRKKWQTSLFQRIMFGLSLSDFVFSGTIMLHPFLLPSSTGLFFAFGNDLTCNIAGSLHMFWRTASLHSCFLSVYFFLVVKRGLNEKTIKTVMEPWIHIVSWGLPVISPSLVLVLGKFHPSPLFACLAETAKDEEGMKFKHSRGLLLVVRVVSSAAVCIPAIVGISLTWLIYLAVRRQARRNSMYGFQSISSQRNTLIVSVGWQAIFYTIAFGNSFLGMVFANIFLSTIGGKDNARWSNLFSLFILFIMIPLQGFLNWLVYVRPTFVLWRQAHPEKSWRWACRQVVSDRPLPAASSSSGRHFSAEIDTGVEGES